MQDFDGKVAVVTGVASGIGVATATRFSEEGMKVVLPVKQAGEGHFINTSSSSGIQSAANIGPYNVAKFGGGYLDELEKRDGQWRTSSRTYVADWTNQFPNGLEAFASSGFELNVLKIMQPDHESYRPP